MKNIIMICLALIYLPASASTELKPAGEVLQLIQDVSGEEAALTLPQQLVLDIRSANVSRGQKQYVALWLGWFDRFWNIDSFVREQHFDVKSERGLRFEVLLTALPSPEIWPHFISRIKKQADSEEDGKKQYILLMIAALLEGDQDAQMRLSEDYFSGLSSDDRYSVYQIESYIDDVFIRSANKNISRQYLNDKLSRAKSSGESTYIHLPNLIPIYGAEDAIAMIRQVLKSENVYVNTNSIQTSNAIKNEIIALGDQVKTPQWDFVNAIEPISIALFESASFSRRLPGDEDRFLQASAYYLFSLVIDQQIDKALLVAKENDIKISSIDSNVFKKIIDAGYAKSIYEFIRRYMGQSSDMELLETYIDLAIAAGQHSELLGYLNALRKSNKNKGAESIRLDVLVTKAYFAVGDAENGFDEFGKLRANYKKRKEMFAALQDALLPLAVNVMNAGFYSDNPRWYAEGKVFAGELSRDWLVSKGALYYAYIDALIVNGDLVGAQNVLVEHARLAATSANFSASPEAAEYLMFVYAKAGQCQEVLALLDGYKGWGAMDATLLMFHKVGSPSIFVGEYVSACLIDQGRSDVARSMLELLMAYEPGYDPAYSLYKKVVGAGEAIEYFDKLYHFDAFEERPLIWKASVLMDQGKFSDALSVLQKALTIDPSDGEQHLGRRMLAYQLMGEVYDALGDTQKAQDFKGIIDAIRLAEKADKLNAAGFNQKAVSMYDEASKRFSGAYCIQSRLAVRQNAFGLTEQSLEHYRRAYELMPDSFGYMESHCLGCSAVFKNKSGQELAEKVFQDLLNHNTNKPQIYYMMGYLKKTQKDYTSAWAFFQKAASLDGGYINAWSEMNKVQRELIIKQSDYDQTITNLIRLDPMVRHVDIGEHTVRDLKALWTSTEAIGNESLPKIEPTYKLKASADTIELSLGALNPAQRKVFIEYYSAARDMGRDSPILPAEVLSQHKGVQAISSLIDY